MKARNIIAFTLLGVAGAVLLHPRGRKALSEALVVPGDTMYATCLYVAFKQWHRGGMLVSVPSVMAPALPHVLYADKSAHNIECLRDLRVLHFRPFGKPLRRDTGVVGFFERSVRVVKALRHQGTWVEEPFETHMKRMGWIPNGDEHNDDDPAASPHLPPHAQ